MNAIVNGCDFEGFVTLLEFLAAWEKRPICLAPITYKWCSAFSEVAEFGPQPWSLFRLRSQRWRPPRYLSDIEWVFSFVGPDFDAVRMGETSDHTCENPHTPANLDPGLLVTILEVGFRLVTLGRDQPALHLGHTPHHDLVFKCTFSDDDDEVIADGVCAWIADGDHMPAGSCVHYLTQRTENERPFSPRLRRMCIHLIERMWRSKLWMPELESIDLLNRIEVGVDEMEDRGEWGMLLAGVVHSPAVLKSLSIHYWHLLRRLPWSRRGFLNFRSHAAELVRMLEEAEDWEKLEAWMVTVWQFNGYWYGDDPENLERLKQATLKHLLRRPSALPLFEGVAGIFEDGYLTALEDICAQARTEELPLESLSP